MKFEFATATKITFGPGALREVGTLAKAHGDRALVVTGRDSHRADALWRVLDAARIGGAIYSVPGEPEIGTVEVGVATAREQGCTQVVSFGGGSAIDAGKAIAAMLTNNGEVLDYLEVIGRGKPLEVRAAPFIAIPTTAGTGSEVTRNAVIGSPEHRVKVSLRSPLMLPNAAVIDPELTYELPPDVTASTGLDALTQLIEPFVCNRANPMTDALCREGMQRVARSLRRAFKNGHDPAAREDMALAALFGGLALANAGLGAVHGFAGPIGGMFEAPHGAVCAILLPEVLKTNRLALATDRGSPGTKERFDEIARVLTGRRDARAEEGEAWVRELVQDLGVPRLGRYGVGTADLPGVVERAAQASSMKANPVVLSKDELDAILQAAL